MPNASPRTKRLTSAGELHAGMTGPIEATQVTKKKLTPVTVKPVKAKLAKLETKPAVEPFWKQKSLEAMNAAEWESLCDGCGRCCLVKLEDEDTGQIHFTDVACKLFSAETCRCGDYAHRRRKVRDCIKLTPTTVRALTWLPPSCAYRLIAEGRDLAWWHPLVSGSADSVHEAGVSVLGRVKASETEVRLDDYPDYIVKWPGQTPRAAKRKAKRVA
jgi:uncharacterized cysteine cluster protein YcgN (CxxCxxCC family)